MAQNTPESPTPPAVNAPAPTPVEVSRRGAPMAGAPVGFFSRFFLPLRGLSSRRVWLARILAGVADCMQWGLIATGTPLGVLSPVNIIIDVAMMLAMTYLLGWHIAFLPSFVVEEVPVLNMAPTWTIAVVYATWGASDDAAVAGKPVPAAQDVARPAER